MTTLLRALLHNPLTPLLVVAGMVAALAVTAWHDHHRTHRTGWPR